MPEFKKSPVKSMDKGQKKRVVVGQAEYPVYASIQDALDHLKDEKMVLSLINTQAKTNALNEIRAGVTQKPTKAALQMQAFAAIPITELQQLQGNPAALKQRIDQEVTRLENEAENTRQQRIADAAKAAAEAGVSDEDDDDDEAGE